ncbi:MAG: GNAT family N-acetyltransferase, partial [Verrucomicrobiales bacterium]
YQVFPREEDIYFLEQAGARRVDTKLHSMVLCGEPAAPTAKTWNHTVRRSKESGVTVRAGGDDDLPAAWKLVEEALERHGQSAVHSVEDIALLRSRFPASVLLLLAEGGSGELLSARVVLRYGRTLTLLYVGDAPDGRELNAGTLLQDHMMKAAENSGFWFDLGQWCDTDSRQGSTPLLQYKEASGGRLIQRHTWQLDL